jgi:hypothetical protein
MKGIHPLTRPANRILPVRGLGFPEGFADRAAHRNQRTDLTPRAVERRVAGFEARVVSQDETRELEFIDNLPGASRLIPPPSVSSGLASEGDADLRRSDQDFVGALPTP